MRAYLLAVTLVATTASAQPALGERMLVAEDQRAPTDAELATLKQGLGSPDAATRRQAVRAIGRLERADLLPVISPLLTDRNTDVRIEAINALGQVARGQDGLSAAKSRLLARARAEQTPRVRGVAAATLGRLPYTGAADVQQVEHVLAQMLPPASKEQRAAVVNLDEIAGTVEGLEALIRQSGKTSPPEADTIARLRGVGTIEGRAQDAETLARIRRLVRAALIAAGRPEAELLEAGVADPDDEVRRLTMIAARVDVPNREPILRKGLGDSEARVRYEALQTWGRTLLNQACAPVLSALRDPNVHVRLLAIDLLGNGCSDTKQDAIRSLRAVAEAVSSSSTSWHAPAHALVALAKLSAADARTLLPLYVAHTLWQVRMYAAQAAGKLSAIDE